MAGGWDNTLKQEFNTSYREMLDSGMPTSQARKALGDAYKYFDGLRVKNMEIHFLISDVLLRMWSLNMDESQVRIKLKEIEVHLGGKLSEDYKKLSSEMIQEADVYELTLVSGGQVYLYGCSELLERNATYQVQVYESDYFLIGQDGDLGYFLSLRGEDEIYSLDLGALGSLDMNKEADSIYGL